jgi:hypothetical protein
MRPLFLSLLAFLIVVSSCDYVGGKRVRGNGSIKTENISVDKFTDIEVHGAIDVKVKKDSITSVKVASDENLLPYIEISNHGNTLEIRTRSGYSLRPSDKLVVYVNTASLNHIDLTGATTISSDGKFNNGSPLSFDLSGACEVNMDIACEKVDVKASGASDIRLRGETKDLRIEGQGATKIRCFDLLSENTVVKLSGAGEAEVFASVKLEARTSGAADVRYKGNGVVTSEISGAGSIKKAD